MRRLLAATALWLIAVPALAFDRHHPTNPYHGVSFERHYDAPRYRSKPSKLVKRLSPAIAKSNIPAKIETVLSEGLKTVASFAHPRVYRAGSLTCALNVNLALAAVGIKGTGSRMAKSFLRWGKPTTPKPGAVAIYNRGRNPALGHVAIVAFVKNGRVWVYNPTSHRGWQLRPQYKPAIAYRTV